MQRFAFVKVLLPYPFMSKNVSRNLSVKLFIISTFLLLNKKQMMMTPIFWFHTHGSFFIRILYVVTVTLNFGPYLVKLRHCHLKCHQRSTNLWRLPVVTNDFCPKFCSNTHINMPDYHYKAFSHIKSQQ